MPAKKTHPSTSILLDKSECLKAEQASNEQELEDNIRKLINLANNKYNETFRSKRITHIKEFPLCKKNYTKIKTIIDDQAISSNLIKIYYLEAELACIQADFNALSFNPNSNEQLNLIKENLKKIKLAFDKFNEALILNSKLDKKDTSEALNQLLTYRNNFLNSWNKNSNRLLGDCNYNFAESFVDKLDLENAKKYFTQSADFYKQANLSDFENQTNERLKELKLTPKELLDSSIAHHYKDIPSKVPVLALTKLSPTSLENKAIKTEPLWTISSKATLEKPDENQPNRRKRKSFDNAINPAKKIKKEHSISSSNNELEGVWTTEREKILNKFKDLNIDVNLAHLSNNEKSFDERRAIVHNNYAIFLIEDLNNSEKKYSDAEKIASLKKAEQLLAKSLELYKNANLLEKNNNVAQCIRTIRSSLTTLETNITKSKDTSSTKTNACKKTKSFNEKYHEYQGIYSARLACKFFKDASASTHINNQNLIKICP